MKTKIKIKLEDHLGQLLPNTSYTISPYKINRRTSGNVEISGVSDMNGEAIVSLSPAWYPYRLEYTDPAKGKLGKYFLVVESTETIDLEDVLIGHLDINFLTPAGSAIAAVIKANVDAKNALKKIKDAEKTAIDKIASAQLKAFNDKLQQTMTGLSLFSSLVEQVSQDKTLILNQQRELQRKLEEVMQAHADMIEIAKDYVIAKNMGALNLGGHYIWFDSNNTFRWKLGAPLDEFDGTPIN